MGMRTEATIVQAKKVSPRRKKQKFSLVTWVINPLIL